MFRDYFQTYSVLRRTKVPDNKGSFTYNETTVETLGYLQYVSQSEKYFAMQNGSSLTARFYTDDDTLNINDIVIDGAGRRFRIIDKIKFVHLFYELGQDNAG